jgi:hypothetical protein
VLPLVAAVLLPFRPEQHHHNQNQYLDNELLKP